MSSSPAQSRVGPVALSYPEVQPAGELQSGAQKELQEQQRREEAQLAGIREGEAKARAAYEKEIQECRKGVAAALEEFARQRSVYFLAVEREVVQLAFALARKILRREAQLDPFLLAGMVRVALDQVSEASKVTVRVSPQQAADFRIFFAQYMPENTPEVLEDASLDSARCVIETSLGKTEIGPEIQLEEIEQGLLDLQAARPC